MTTDLEKEREAIRAAYVAHFGSDAGWRCESGGGFIEGYRAALAAPAAPQEQPSDEAQIEWESKGRLTDIRKVHGGFVLHIDEDVTTLRQQPSDKAIKNLAFDYNMEDEATAEVSDDVVRFARALLSRFGGNHGK